MSQSRKDRRQKRHERVRRKVAGTAERPRMSIMLSSRHLYVQFIDDEKGATLVSASSLGGDGKTNLAAAKALGQKAGQAAVAKGIGRAVVDRGGFKFHGRVKAIVDGAVEAGVAIANEAKAGPVHKEEEK